MADRALKVWPFWKILADFNRFESPLLRTGLPGLGLANPVGLAAGYDKTCSLLPALSALGFGYVTCGTDYAAPAERQPGYAGGEGSLAWRADQLARVSEPGAGLGRRAHDPRPGQTGQSADRGERVRHDGRRDRHVPPQGGAADTRGGDQYKLAEHGGAQGLSRRRRAGVAHRRGQRGT